MDAVQLLDDTITGLAADKIHLLEDAAVAERLVALGKFKSRLAAYEAELTRSFDGRGAFQHDGSKTTAAWLMRNCLLSGREAAAQVRLARRLRKMPATRKALEDGDITVEKAAVLARLGHSHRRVVREAFPVAEETLVHHAKGLLFEGFVQMTDEWEDLVDPDGTESTAEDDYDARNLYASELLRGCVRVDGTLDPVGGAIFLGELTRIERAMFDADWRAARALHGENTRVEHLCRSPAQRRADALQEMARRSAELEAAKDAEGRSRPLFVVHVGPDVVKRMCELASGTLIAPGLLVPHLGEADIERIVYGPKSRVIDLSKKARFFRGGLRRAMEHRDRRCTMPGCDEPAEYCEGDHVTPHSHGGETTQEDGRLLCRGHNRWAYNHEQRHHIYGATGTDPPGTVG